MSPLGLSTMRDHLALLPFLSFDAEMFRGSASTGVTEGIPLTGVFGIVVLAVFVLVAFNPTRLVPKRFVGVCVCVLYLLASLFVDIFVAKNRVDDIEILSAVNPLCVVTTMELIKLGMSMILYLGTFEKGEGEHGYFIPEDLTFHSVKWLCVPALTLSVNNILVFAVGRVDSSTFGIFWNSVIICTAFAWCYMFKTALNNFRISCIVIIMFGLAMMQWTAFVAGSFSLSVLWLIAMVLFNAIGAVSCEYALKTGSNTDINFQNMIMYSGSFLCAFALLVVTDSKRVSLGAAGIFEGFNDGIWSTIGLQACVGLMVSRMLKHADALMKSVVLCLRGPLFVLLSWMFTLSSKATNLILVSAVITTVGCALYLHQGTMTVKKELDATGGDLPS
eukprot:CAMPEP_0194514520 /NCGR_PEP_ID=MMETSP0253-20130528/46985_1 /TAXON_ID=2966 /ORGANISM="Noctiluca scintillans" /LENGTH=389 /DNA_ID=CAMNT_0039358185 /DNA_START=110 /DNA_END=1279 /DNA_ORIENTATION=+